MILAPLDPTRDWMRIFTWPTPVKELARLYPNHTYVHTIPWSDVLAEKRKVSRALSLGGYHKADRIDPLPIAAHALIEDLRDIAIEHDIDYDADCAMNADDDLEVTMVFGNVADMVLFKLALP